MTRLILLLCAVDFCVCAQAIFTTPDPPGQKGEKAVYFDCSYTRSGGVGGSYCEVGGAIALSKAMVLSLAPNWTSQPGGTQTSAYFGPAWFWLNTKSVRAVALADVNFPLTHRAEDSTASLYTGVVFSTPVKVNHRKLDIYAGWTPILSLGPKAGRPRAVEGVSEAWPIGIKFDHGNMMYMFEFSLFGINKAGGAGGLYTFPDH